MPVPRNCVECVGAGGAAAVCGRQQTHQAGSRRASVEVVGAREFRPVLRARPPSRCARHDNHHAIVKNSRSRRYAVARTTRASNQACPLSVMRVWNSGIFRLHAVF